MTDSFRDGNAELRRRNRSVVEDYMGRRGENRLTRYLLFTEDGTSGLYTGDTPEPIVSCGHETLRAHGEWSLRMFPDWHWFNIEVSETQDPNRFWVECDGEGQILYPDYPPGHYRNHFLHSFLLADGKIVQQREFMNPYNQLRALSIDIPVIRRGGIPTGGASKEAS
ncbi:Phenazine biosynthesis protein PhzB [Alloactinosynnema sp. L-07]|uniref:PhzA/PhzB family protein n=1 Tax=Alloactinosynnema sp. L-07 TaxID=1653480 RepID=UPI00065EF4A6|nr:PhzA/PhzB family protein [Alloactinosynnema sp. L-07]CRK58745.1 Phenazine biosynthesis protein PhzB [Alloactinosynnema sp. L-07]